MDFYGFDRTRALANYDGLRTGNIEQALAQVSGWQRLQPGHVLELLARAAPEARQDARTLAALLMITPWRIGVFAPPPASQLVSNARQITVSAGGRKFHLHLIQTHGLKLERITG